MKNLVYFIVFSFFLSANSYAGFTVIDDIYCSDDSSPKVIRENCTIFMSNQSNGSKTAVVYDKQQLKDHFNYDHGHDWSNMHEYKIVVLNKTKLITSKKLLNALFNLSTKYTYYSAEKINLDLWR